MSWDDIEGATLDENQGVFTLKFRALSDVVVSDVISMSSDITRAEAYSFDQKIDIDLV